MGKTCATPSLNSSSSSSNHNQSQSQSQSQSHSHQHHQHTHQHQQQHHHHSVPLPPPPPPQPLQPQQQQHFPQKYMNSKRKHANNYHNMLMHPSAHLDHNNYLHLNSLWSIWYGVLLTLFQGYLAVHGAYRFLGCSLISWKIEPVAELNLQIVLSGVVFILLPFFFTSAVFKVGNLANDGIKLATGSKERRCSMSPHDGLEEEARGGTLRALWTHGGPTAAFVHIVIAICLLLPRLLLEARIIENGLLPRDNIWQTELDFIAMNRRNLVVLSVVTAPYQNGTGNSGGDASSTTNLDDDSEEDYYNDTMFTAVGESGASGGNGASGGSGMRTNINNNMLDIYSTTIHGKPTKHMGNRKAESKRTRGNNVGVDFIDGGKTRYFEVPELINRDSNEEPEKDDDANNGDDDIDDGDDDVNAEEDIDNKYDFKQEADIYDGRVVEGGSIAGGVVGVGVDDDGDGVERIFVEHFDTKELWQAKPVNIPQLTTTKATIRTTRTPTTTTTTTTTTGTLTAASESSELGVYNNRNYDKVWDKLGKLGKANSFGAGDIDTVSDVARKTTETSTTATNEQSSTMGSSVRAPKTIVTTTANNLDKSTGHAADAAATTTTITKPTATTGRNTKLTSKIAPRISSTTSSTMTLTASDTSDSSMNNNSNERDNGVHLTTTAATPAAHTQPTRTRNHQQHNHQHHKEQSQAPQQSQPAHTAKSTRKHHGHNRQHHRQRGGQHHNRRQHSNPAAAGGGGAGGRSNELSASRTSSSRLDVGRAAADLRPSNAFASAADIDLNRLDDLDLSAAGTTFEQSITSSRGQNRDSAASFDMEALDYEARRIHGKSTSTISTTTRDSNIHIVKPEKLPEIIPSTPLTSNSKIIEIKTKSSSSGGAGVGVKRTKRMATEQMQVEIEPEYLVGELSANDSSEYMAPSSTADADDSASSSSTANSGSIAPQQPSQTNLMRLDGFAGMLQIFFGIEKPIDLTVFEHPPSAEFVNLIFALLVWCVRYPAVFWTTTKSFATIFSIQMIAVALDIIFSYIGAANLYKLQVYSEAMPIQNPGLILNGVVTLALFLLSSVLMIASSMIMYLYGHGRLAAKMRDRSLITMKSSETWIYFAHCASLCYVLALAVVKAPLLNDLSVTYKNNLHCPTFLSALISVAHLLLWIVIWLGLTAKRRWTFKLPPMDAYGITKASTQPLLMANRSSLPSAGSVSGSGSNLGSSDHKSGGGGGIGSGVGSGGGGIGSGCGSGSSSGGRGGKLSTESSTDGGNDDVYWPKLTPSSPKLKVTFNEVPSTSDDVLLIGDHEQNDGKRHSPRGAAICFASLAGEIDDGEYATLRAANAATMAGISMTSMSSRMMAHNKANNKGSNIDPGMTIGCGNETHIGGIPNTSNTSTTTPTGAYGMKLLQLSEYDELPPPPPPQLISTMGGHQQQQHSAAARSDYVNCGGGGGGGTGSGSFGDDSTSEEGKLLACVRDDSVTYASTRDLEPPAAATTPPLPPPPLHTANGVADHQQLSSVANAHMSGGGAVGVNSLKEMRMNGGSGGGGGGAAAATMAGRAPQAIPENMQLSSSPEHLVSPLAPVTVTVHTNEAHIASSSTPRCLRRADSGVPNEALTPRSDTTSTTESTTSPPERAPSESSSGVHSGEERDVEVVIRPRAACKPPPKPPQPAIQEEPYGRCTNMRMSSFGGDISALGAAIGGSGRALNSATLPLTRSAPEQKFDYANHCSTMPLPVANHSQQQAVVAARGSGNYGMTTSAYSMHAQPPLPPPPLHTGLSSFRSQYANSSVAMAGANAARMQHEQQQQQQQQQPHQQQQQQYSQPQSTSPPPPPPPAGMHTTLPNGVRYSNPHFLRRLPHVTKAAESPYGHLGLGAGHHTFSKLLQDPLQNSLVNTTIPEDRDSANYSMSSEHDCGNLYATAQSYN